MWIYEKKLEFPVNIKKPDARLAKIMIEQYGGADGELSASIRYLSQKFTMVTPQAKATLNDIGTEELAHLEMMGTIVKQLTQGLTDKQIKEAGLDDTTMVIVTNTADYSKVTPLIKGTVTATTDLLEVE